MKHTTNNYCMPNFYTKCLSAVMSQLGVALFLFIVIGVLNPEMSHAADIQVNGVINATNLSTIVGREDPQITNVGYANVNEGWNRFNIDAPRGWARLNAPSEVLSPIGTALICTRTTFEAQEDTFRHRYFNPGEINPCETYMATPDTQLNPTNIRVPFIELVPSGTVSDTIGGQKLPIAISPDARITQITLRATDRFQNVAFFAQVIGKNGENWVTSATQVDSNGGTNNLCKPGGENTPANHIISPYNHSEMISRMSGSNCFESKTVRFTATTGMPSSVQKIRIWFTGFNNGSDGKHKGDHVIIDPSAGITVTTEDVPADICGAIKGDDGRAISNWPVQISTPNGVQTVITTADGRFNYSGMTGGQQYSVTLPDNASTPIVAPFGYVGAGVTINGNLSYSSHTLGGNLDCAKNCGCNFVYNKSVQCEEFKSYNVSETGQIVLKPDDVLPTDGTIKITQANSDIGGLPDRQELCWTANDPTAGIYGTGRQAWACMYTCMNKSDDATLLSQVGKIKTWRAGQNSDLNGYSLGIMHSCDAPNGTTSRGELSGSFASFITALPDGNIYNPESLRDVARTNGLIFIQNAWNHQDPGGFFCTTNPVWGTLGSGGVIWNGGPANILFGTLCGRVPQTTQSAVTNDCKRIVRPLTCENVMLNPPLIPIQEWEFKQEVAADGSVSWKPIVLTWHHIRESFYQTETFVIKELFNIPLQQFQVSANNGEFIGTTSEGSSVYEYSFNLPQTLISQLYTQYLNSNGSYSVRIASTTAEQCSNESGLVVIQDVENQPGPGNGWEEEEEEPITCEDGSPGPICPTITATVSLHYSQPGSCIASEAFPNGVPLTGATAQLNNQSLQLRTNDSLTLDGVSSEVFSQPLRLNYTSQDYICANSCGTIAETGGCRTTATGTRFDFVVTNSYSSFDGWFQTIGGLAFGRTIHTPIPNDELCPLGRCLPFFMASPTFDLHESAGIAVAERITAPTSDETISQRPDHDYAEAVSPDFAQLTLPTIGSSIHAHFASQLAPSGNVTEKSAQDVMSFDFSSAPVGDYFWVVPESLNLSIEEPLRIGAGRRFIMLVEGSVTIASTAPTADSTILNEGISVEPGGLFMIVAKGDIIIDASVGEKMVLSDYSSYNSQSAPSALEGIFMSDSRLIIEAGPAEEPDRRFVGEGTYVGAQGILLQREFSKTGFTSEQDRMNGKFLYAFTPTEIFRHRPDMVLNLPRQFYSSLQTFQEIQ